MARSTGNKRTDDEVTEPISESWAVAHLPRREAGAHKWSVGGVVVVAGSPPFAGAAALCCAAAGRSGAGIVSAALSRSIAGLVVGLVPEVTVIILPEGDSVRSRHDQWSRSKNACSNRNLWSLVRGSVTMKQRQRSRHAFWIQTDARRDRVRQRGGKVRE